MLGLYYNVVESVLKPFSLSPFLVLLKTCSKTNKEKKSILMSLSVLLSIAGHFTRRINGKVISCAWFHPNVMLKIKAKILHSW